VGKLEKYRHSLKELKGMQTDHLKLMNELFSSIMNPNNESKSQLIKRSKLAQQSQAAVARVQESEEEVRLMSELIEKILCCLKDNLWSVLTMRDGVYCVLFLRNAVQFLVGKIGEAEEAGVEGDDLDFYFKTLDFIWQSLHHATSILTNTQKKISCLSRNGSSLSTAGAGGANGGDADSRTSESRSDQDDLSQFENFSKSLGESVLSGGSAGE